MTLSAVQGQRRAVDTLRAALGRDAVAHGYLFEGPEGVGREMAALGLTQALLCTERPGEGCGTCHVCDRVTRRLHPDVQWLMPEEEQVRRGLAGKSDFDHTPSKDIRVEQIRKLQERLALRPLEGTRKICIVASAERLNAQAQNAFLKTLEEPPAQTVIVLLCSAPDKLLPTLRSRLVRLSFGPLPQSMIAAQLAESRKDLPPAEVQALAAFAQGSLSRALSMDPEQLAHRRLIIEAFSTLTADPRSWLRFAEQFAGSREDVEQTLITLSEWLRDVLLVASGAQPKSLLHTGLSALAATVSERLSPVQIHAFYSDLLEARENITTRNAGPRLQMERLLIRLHRVGGNAS